MTERSSHPPSKRSPRRRARKAGSAQAQPTAGKSPSPKPASAAGPAKKRASRAKPGTKPPRRTKPASTHRAPITTYRWAAYAALAVAAVVVAVVGTFVVAPGPGDGRSVELTWSPAMSPGQAADRLSDAGLVRSAWLMSLYLRFAVPNNAVDPGVHLVQDDMSPRTLVRRLRRLVGGATVRVPIPEGFDKFDVAQRLHDKGVCSQRAFLESTTDAKLLGELRLAVPDAEGYMFPATYDFPRNHPPEAVIRRMVLESEKRYARAFDDHAAAVDKLAKDLGWTRHHIVTLASMVEKEAAVDEERPLVASVFLNRMYSSTFLPPRRLQSDPTARYGCLLHPDVTTTCAGAAKGVTGPMVRDALNPYSTYAHAGLPPSPICNPSERSVQAVLTPAETKFLYFVAKGNGRHTFSETYDAHRDAVRSRPTSPER